MAHTIYARLIGHSRTIVTTISAILGALVALGIIPKGAETAILTIVGALMAYVAGDAYIQGKHVEAAASVAVADKHAAIASKGLDMVNATADALKTTAAPAPTDPHTTVTPSTGS
jgi:hypothetical protein